MSGRKARPMVSMSPTRTAARNAPRVEQIPSMRITTKASINMFSPMPICTVRIGLHQSGKPRERRAETEDEGVKQVDIDAERAGHLPVGSARADQHAGPGPHHQDVEKQRDQER